VAPIVIVTLGALSTAETELLKSLYWVEALWVLLELGPSQGFDFLIKELEGHMKSYLGSQALHSFFFFNHIFILNKLGVLISLY